MRTCSLCFVLVSLMSMAYATPRGMHQGQGISINSKARDSFEVVVEVRSTGRQVTLKRFSNKDRTFTLPRSVKQGMLHIHVDVVASSATTRKRVFVNTTNSYGDKNEVKHDKKMGYVFSLPFSQTQRLPQKIYIMMTLDGETAHESEFVINYPK